MAVALRDIVTTLKAMAPLSLKESWDNPGLLVGNPNEIVHKGLVTLDVMMDTVDQAISIGADVIVSHHPVIFSGLKALRTDTYDGAMFQKLLSHHIAVFSAHTNLDSADGGVNDVLAKTLGLTNVHGFVPVRPSEPMDHAYTMGRVGEWPQPQRAVDALKAIKKVLQLADLPYAGDGERVVRTVAILGGGGASFIDEAAAAGVDLYLTGDVKYHDAQAAIKAGIIIADGTHFGTEHPVVADLARRLNEASVAGAWGVNFETDPTSRDMFQHI